MKLLTNSTRAQLEIGTEVSRSIDSPTEFARTILLCFERDKDWIEYHAEQLAELAVVYRSWFLGHFASGNHAAAPVLGKSAWRTAAGVRWPWRSTSQAWL